MPTKTISDVITFFKYMLIFKIKANYQLIAMTLKYSGIVEELENFFSCSNNIKSLLSTPVALTAKVTVEQLDEIQVKAQNLNAKISGNLQELVAKVNELEKSLRS